MFNTQKRYKGPAENSDAYRDECIVECPKCKKDAFVRVTGRSFNSTAKLTCYNCMFSEDTSNLIRYRMTVSRHCDNCGMKINKEVCNQKEPIAELLVSCPRCGVARVMQPRHETYRLTYGTATRGHDPYFHLPLWLQAEVKGNVFWAYNKQHLGVIKDYIQATLRERQTKGYMTMVEKLPRFIIHAKNRKAILKAISYLESY